MSQLPNDPSDGSENNHKKTEQEILFANTLSDIVNNYKYGVYSCYKCGTQNRVSSGYFCGACGRDQSNPTVGRRMIWLGAISLSLAVVIVVIMVSLNAPAAGPVYLLGLFFAGFGVLSLIRGIVKLAT